MEVCGLNGPIYPTGREYDRSKLFIPLTLLTSIALIMPNNISIFLNLQLDGNGKLSCRPVASVRYWWRLRSGRWKSWWSGWTGSWWIRRRKGSNTAVVVVDVGSTNFIVKIAKMKRWCKSLIRQGILQDIGGGEGGIPTWHMLLHDGGAGDEGEWEVITNFIVKIAEMKGMLQDALGGDGEWDMCKMSLYRGDGADGEAGWEMC